MFDDLLTYYQAAELILVDIPIGLRNGPGERRCDKQARRRLRPHGSRVFPAPTRAALQHLVNHLGDGDGAKDEHIRITGTSLTQQTLAIMPKIAEVDNVLSRALTPQIREVHPEIYFWALNGENPIGPSKHTEKGIEERIRVLMEGQVEPRARQIFDEGWRIYQSHCVGKDDILDALVAAVTAYQGRRDPDQLPVLPEPAQNTDLNLPIRDEQADLPMEMVFWRPPAANIE